MQADGQGITKENTDKTTKQQRESSTSEDEGTTRSLTTKAEKGKEDSNSSKL